MSNHSQAPSKPRRIAVAVVATSLAVLASSGVVTIASGGLHHPGTLEVRNVALFDNALLVGLPYTEPTSTLRITHLSKSVCSATDRTGKDSNVYYLPC